MPEDEQIKTLAQMLEGERSTGERMHGLSPDNAIAQMCFERRDALTYALDAIRELAEYRELMTAAADIVIVDGNLPDGGTVPHHIFNVGTGWIIDSNRDNDKEYASPTEALTALQETK